MQMALSRLYNDSERKLDDEITDVTNEVNELSIDVEK